MVLWPVQYLWFSFVFRYGGISNPGYWRQSEHSDQILRQPHHILPRQQPTGRASLPHTEPRQRGKHIVIPAAMNKYPGGVVMDTAQRDIRGGSSHQWLAALLTWSATVSRTPISCPEVFPGIPNLVIGLFSRIPVFRPQPYSANFVLKVEYFYFLFDSYSGFKMFKWRNPSKREIPLFWENFRLRRANALTLVINFIRMNSLAIKVCQLCTE